MLLFTILLSFIERSKVRVVIILLSIFSSLLQFYYFQYFGNYIQPIAFLQFFTHTGEVVESFLPLIIEMIIPTLIILAIFPAFYLFDQYMDKRKFSFRYGGKILLLGFALHLAISYTYLNPKKGEKITHRDSRQVYPKETEHSFSNFVRSFNTLWAGIIPKKILGKFPEFEISDKPMLETINPKMNIVFILGESLRCDRLSLLGYNKQTTPNLDLLKSKDAISVKSIYSGGVMTKTSTNVLFNRLKYPGMMAQTMQGNNNIFKLAKGNGFNTYFVSNQTKKQLVVLDLLFSKHDVTHYYNRESLVKSIANKTGFDIGLLEMLKKIDFSENNLIVLQQRGSHTPYKSEYPTEFNLFTSTYNNSVYYTDFVLSKIINYILLTT